MNDLLQQTVHALALSIMDAKSRHGAINTVYVPDDEWAVVVQSAPDDVTPDLNMQICGARILPLSQCN